MKVREKRRNRTESVSKAVGVSLMVRFQDTDGGRDGWERTEAQRTKDELLNGRVDVHAHGHLELVDLELQPLAEGLELGSHGGLWAGSLSRDGREKGSVGSQRDDSVLGSVSDLLDSFSGFAGWKKWVSSLLGGGTAPSV